MKIHIILCILVFAATNALASDLARERRIADELSDAVVEGDSVFIEVGDHRFWSIYTEAQGQSKGAVIILHGRGLHPDTPAVARPLRTALPKQGWSTLALQLPVLPKGSEFEDYANIFPEAEPRIEAGIRYLRSLGYSKVHLVAHSCGGQMTMAWIDAGGGQDLSSLTVVSLGMTKYEQRFGHLPPLGKLTIPIMDIYGAKDFVAKRAPERQRVIQAAGNPLSRQLEVPNAKHMFKKQGLELTNAVANWLEGVR
jgi:pimeloyl-ACP methyl ester carboxylesterase